MYATCACTLNGGVANLRNPGLCIQKKHFCALNVFTLRIPALHSFISLKRDFDRVLFIVVNTTDISIYCTRANRTTPDKACKTLLTDKQRSEEYSKPVGGSVPRPTASVQCMATSVGDAQKQLESRPNDVEAQDVEAQDVEAQDVEAQDVEAQDVEAQRRRGARVRSARVRSARVRSARVRSARVRGARLRNARRRSARCRSRENKKGDTTG